MLARARHGARAYYACLTRTATHCSWLQSTHGRQTLRAVCPSGGPLHSGELEESINTHFKDVLEQFSEQDNVQNSEPKDKYLADL